jgi:hypothetical protein
MFTRKAVGRAMKCAKKGKQDGGHKLRPKRGAKNKKVID